MNRMCKNTLFDNNFLNFCMSDRWNACASWLHNPNALYSCVCAKNWVVGLHHGRWNLWGWVNGKFPFGLLAIVHENTLHQQRRETPASSRQEIYRSNEFSYTNLENLIPQNEFATTDKFTCIWKFVAQWIWLMDDK